MKAAIVVDNWKLSIFRETLDANDYEYEELKGPFPECTTLMVHTDDIVKLAPIVAKMNEDAAKSKMH